MRRVSFPGTIHELSVGDRYVAELVTAGLVAERGEGLIGSDWDSVVRFLVEHPELAICDFCSRSPVTMEFPVRDYDVRVPGTVLPLRDPTGRKHRNLGAWLACLDCAVLVRAGKRDALALRSVGLLAAGGTTPPVEIMRAIHDEFWRNREGDGRPVGS